MLYEYVKRSYLSYIHLLLCIMQALIMNGSTLLKDLSINQLNMGEEESLFIYEVWEGNYREETLHILLF